MNDLISRQAAIDAIFGRSHEIIKMRIGNLPSAPQWIPLHFESEGETNFPYELDGRWVIVTDGETISVERIKKDAYDHFFPNGRWFGLEDVKAWMPLPEPYKEVTE